MICSTCRQEMDCPPREGTSGKDCPHCGQGLSKATAKRIFAKRQRPARQAQGKPWAWVATYEWLSYSVRKRWYRRKFVRDIKADAQQEIEFRATYTTMRNVRIVPLYPREEKP